MRKIIFLTLFLAFGVVAMYSCCSKSEKTCTETSANKQMIITASVKVKPEKVATFIEKTKELIAQSRAESGNISYTLYQNPTDSCQFIFFEEWKDQAAIDFHFNTPHFKEFGPVSDDCSQEPAQIKIYEAVVVK